MAWSDDTVERIVAEHPEHFRLIPTIESAAGSRHGELFRLSVDDKDSERIVSMSAVVAKVVRDHLDRFATTTTISWERVDREVP